MGALKNSFKFQKFIDPELKKEVVKRMTYLCSTNAYKIAPELSLKFMEKHLFHPQPYKLRSKEKSAFDSASKSHLYHRGNRIQLYKWGEGEPILLVHGWGSTGLQLQEFIEPIVANGYSVYSYDNPAHGSSSGKGSNFFQFVDTLKYIGESIEGLRGIVAHSFGAGASFELAQHLDNRIPFVLISPVYNIEVTIKGFTQNYGLNENMVDGFIAMVEKKYNLDFTEVNPKNKVKKLLQRPVLLIHDQDDIETPVSNSKNIFDQWKGSSIHLTKGLGHYRILRSKEVVEIAIGHLNNYSRAF